METIDLITLRDFSRRTGQPTHPELLDARPLEHVNKIEIDEEHITIEFDEKTDALLQRQRDHPPRMGLQIQRRPRVRRALGRVIDLARKHLKDLPDNVACPPGCAECCSGYEPFVSKSDVQRIADHLGISYEETMHRYVVSGPRPTDFTSAGCARSRTTSPISASSSWARAAAATTAASTRRVHTTAASSRPSAARTSTTSLPRKASWKIGPAFQPKRRGRARNGKRL